MPGARLTVEERHAIAAWLVEGLTRAEIGRRLRRPTSTITREVARNGGVAGYRAAAAATSSRRRARRLGDPAPRSGAVRGFEERFAATMAHSGLARTPARILAALLTSDDASLSAADLMRRLRVSAASVSKAVGYLEALALVRRERGPGDRRERYVVDDNAWYRSWQREVEICAMWAGAAREGAKVMSDSPAGARLTLLGDYFDHVGRDLADAADRWRPLFT